MPELAPVGETEFLALFNRMEMLRHDMLVRLARDGFDIGLAAMVGHANAVLAALAATSPAAAERVVLSDGGGPLIRLTSYRGAEAIAVVEISRERAVGMASELLAAGSRHRSAA